MRGVKGLCIWCWRCNDVLITGTLGLSSIEAAFIPVRVEFGASSVEFSLLAIEMAVMDLALPGVINRRLGVFTCKIGSLIIPLYEDDVLVTSRDCWFDEFVINELVFERTIENGTFIVGGVCCCTNKSFLLHLVATNEWDFLTVRGEGKL